MGGYGTPNKVLCAWVLPLILSLSPSVATAYDWLQFNGDPAHSGNNTFETAIDRSNVASLVFKFQVSLPAVADGAPVLLQSVSTASGVHDLLFVTTKAGHIVALDAQTGTQVWSRQYAAGACRINNDGPECYTTSSPAIDPNRLYVYSLQPCSISSCPISSPALAPQLRYRSTACGTTAPTPIIAT